MKTKILELLEKEGDQRFDQLHSSLQVGFAGLAIALKELTADNKIMSYVMDGQILYSKL
jgi:DNA-binding HxlR family transcriptional regulator